MLMCIFRSARLSSTVPTEIFFQAKYENDEKDISKPFCNKQASRKSSQSSGQSRTSDKITFESVYSKFKNSLYKHSPASSTSINNSCSSKCRSHSRQPSRGSIRSKTPRSSMTTPVGKTKDPLMMYHDDYTKCDHRLKLYLTMNVYADADEVFWCQIRVGVFVLIKKKRKDFKETQNFYKHYRSLTYSFFSS